MIEREERQMKELGERKGNERVERGKAMKELREERQ